LSAKAACRGAGCVKETDDTTFHYTVYSFDIP
jgi:hypothetical protein